MGAWSVSVTGNDTASDLRQEYTCAFYYYSVEEALKKIDEYVRSMFDESDEVEWCNYIYSLADFMWKKGILTDEVKQEALDMIDSNFGLELWEESGKKILQSRKKALEKFRTQLISPMGKPKKIKPHAYMEDIFHTGDVIAIKLMTEGRTYAKHAQRHREVSSEEFQAVDGKYILIQKVGSYCSGSSEIVPEIKNYWAIFRLFDGVYDEVPVDIEVSQLKDARFKSNMPFFMCESSMFYFKRRKYQLIGNYTVPDCPDEKEIDSVYFSVNNEWWNADSFFLAAMKSLQIPENMV